MKFFSTLELVTIIGIGLVVIITLQAATAGPALTPFNFKVKECKVDTNPDPVSCKEVKHTLNSLKKEWTRTDIDYSLILNHVGGEIVITLAPSEPGR